MAEKREYSGATLGNIWEFIPSEFISFACIPSEFIWFACIPSAFIPSEFISFACIPSAFTPKPKADWDGGTTNGTAT
jgi:hypothetical protein